MSGTQNTNVCRRGRTKTPAEQFRDEWYANFIGILIPATLPLMERLMREAPTRIEAEEFRDRWHAQIASIMMPHVFPFPW